MILLLIKCEEHVRTVEIWSMIFPDIKVRETVTEEESVNEGTSDGVVLFQFHKLVNK